MDSNAEPPQMILQPISSLLPNFFNKLVPKLQERDLEAWWKILCNLQDLLRLAAAYLYKVYSKRFFNSWQLMSVFSLD